LANRAELVRRICQNLGLHQAGQDLAPEDYRLIDEDLPHHLATMAKDGIFTVENLDAIPDAAFTELAAYLAYEYRRPAGITDPAELADLEKGATFAESTLRRLKVLKGTYQPMRASYI
jgi:hypothetical protein